MSDPVVDALEAALSGSADPLLLHRHLARLHRDAGRDEQALAHCRAVLRLRPDDVEMLTIAAASAAALGDPVAAGFAELAAILGSASAPPPSPTGFEADGGPGDEDDGGGDVVALRVLDGDGDGGDPEAPERPRLRLADVGGMEEVKRRLEMSFLGPMRNPQLREMYGKSLRGGLLLWGPPGCGKTFIARATAGELGARFIAVGLADILDMGLGQSEQNLHEIFAQARRNAPCVIFVDEVDALGARRAGLRSHQSWRGVIAQFLTELDGALTDNEGVFVLAATNAPWDVDPALRRPGRLDRTLLVLPPDRRAREAILTYHLRERPTDGVDVAALAACTDGYSGADLAAVAEAAAEVALGDSLRTGVARPIRHEDLLAALRDVTPSTTAWLHTARMFALFGSEGGAYDGLLEYLRERGIA